MFRESEKKLNNPDRIRIRYSENPRDYIEPIDLAFKFASRELLEELKDVHELMGRLNALRRYFLMNQGDFFLYFMSVARTELFGKAEDVQHQRLQGLLELAVTNSNARYDKYADYLKVRLEKFDVVDMLALVIRIDKQIPDKKLLSEGFEPAPKLGEVRLYSLATSYWIGMYSFLYYISCVAPQRDWAVGPGGFQLRLRSEVACFSGYKQ